MSYSSVGFELNQIMVWWMTTAVTIDRFQHLTIQRRRFEKDD